MHLDSPAINRLRKNASLKAVAAAVRKDADKWWTAHRIWHQRWLDGKGTNHENVEKENETAAHASHLAGIADHLERLIG